MPFPFVDRAGRGGRRGGPIHWALTALLRAAPYAAVLALALGLVVYSGANLSNAYPNPNQPFGWPGTANFENAVASVRAELVLAASLPAVIWGARTLRNLKPGDDGVGAFSRTVAVDMGLVWSAVLVGALIGKSEASATPDDALWGFVVAHGMLASSFYMIGLLVSVATRRGAVPVGAGVWLFFVAFYENLVRWHVFREAGYFALRVGDFPGWYYVAQALSPVAGYRAVLILWRKGFRDGLEHAVLDNAALPSWMTAGNFVLFVAALWIVLPFGLAAMGWGLRCRAAAVPRHRNQVAEPSLVGPMSAASQAGLADPDAYEAHVMARAKDRAAGNAPATRGQAAQPPRATHQNASSTSQTGWPESEGDGAGSR